MRKMPCLFVREFHGHNSFTITEQVTPGCEWVLDGEGVATIKRDGTACAVIDGDLYARYDAKRGKAPPEFAIPCSDPDDVTGHWPHWVQVTEDDPRFKWHIDADHNHGEGVVQPQWPLGRRLRGRRWDDVDAERHLDNAWVRPEGTYELCGPKLQANPEQLTHHTLIRHGSEVVDVPMRTFAAIRQYLHGLPHEGLVFWREPGNTDAPMCKIRRADFGFAWPVPS